MEEKIVVYAKQYGGDIIPLTVRVEWLPNGTIKPLMYWTTDGTGFKVVYSSPGVPIALLKEGGEGLRFNVHSEIFEVLEPCSEIPQCRYETYIYLADNRFCQRNIIDGRYNYAGKEYVPVTLDVFNNGEYELIYFTVNGLRYAVEETMSVENGGAFHTGGIGIKHKVEARLVNSHNDDDPDPYNSVCRLAAVYLELNKWFVSVSNTAPQIHEKVYTKA